MILKNVAIVGSSGAVGKELLKLLETRNFPISSIKLLSSERSAGKKLPFKDKFITIEKLDDNSFKDIDISFFSAGSKISKEFAPIAVSNNSLVIDNSSAFRMNSIVPLVVPEINAKYAFNHNGIIANPNCSTIIMNLAIASLHKKFGINRITCSTYQAASGAGMAAMHELEEQCINWVNKKPLPMDIFGKQYIWNLFSHDSPIDIQTGYNEEELKMIYETRKIFNDNINVSATCVRVPVLRTHCISINTTLSKPFDNINTVRDLIGNSKGIELLDDRENNQHPEPLLASNIDNCLVGRIRQDKSQEKGYGVELFVAGDQIRKGAALNAIQIAELFID
uniref:aspartate-semialdehyde dehydrogenase n=1 Tax=Megaviridae environmental sample TaxID=1737588 RepID=A0A5J6VJ08_9VIRU|nr:MAG: semialdehyde dehydrogenase, dimerization domain [Megaviridae environmental sample]